MYKNPKVVFILPSLAGGGAERVVLNLCKILYKTEIELILIILDNSGPLKSLIGNYKVVYLNKSRIRWAIFPLIKKLKLIEPDVIFSTFSHITLPLLALRSYFSSGNNIIARESNMLGPSLKHSKHKFIIDRMHNRYISKAAKILVTSKIMYEDLINRGVNNEKLKILCNPVDEHNIRKISKISRIEGIGLRLVAAGRLVYQKGFDRLIPLISKLSKDTNLTIFGDGPEHENLEKIIINLNLSNQVHLKPYSSQLWSFIAGADAFLLSSRWEGMPNVVLESLSLGTPVIGFNCPGGLDDLLNTTIEGSIKTCNNEFEMIAILKDFLPREKANGFILRDSLLPEQYITSNVGRDLKEIIYSVHYKN